MDLLVLELLQVAFRQGAFAAAVATQHGGCLFRVL